MQKTFAKAKQPLKTVMIQARTTNEVLAEIKCGLLEGADAFGLQMESLAFSERTEKNLTAIFNAGEDKPFYITNYALDLNSNGISTDLRLSQLLLALKCGATLIDVPGDTFHACPDQLTYAPVAVQKQREFISEVHALGGEVLISSHVPDFRTEQQVLDMVLEQKRRGADVAKVVTFSHNDSQLLDNLRTTVALREKAGVPFLFLSAGERCRLHRLYGPMLGCCMWLCVPFRAPITTAMQPLISDLNDFISIIKTQR